MSTEQETADLTQVILDPKTRMELGVQHDAMLAEVTEVLLKGTAVLHGLRRTPDGDTLQDAIDKADEILKTDPVSVAADLALSIIAPLFPKSRLSTRAHVDKGGDVTLTFTASNPEDTDAAQIPLPL